VRASPRSSWLSVAPDALGFRVPGRLIFDPVEDIESIADRMAEMPEGVGDAFVQVAAGLLILAVVNLIHHGDHSFPPVSFASKRERETVDAVIRRKKSSFDELQAVGLVEGAPCPGCRPQAVRPGDLFERAVFDERTGPVAISHGVPSFLLWAAGDGGWEGRGKPSPAAGMLSMIPRLVPPIKHSTGGIKLPYDSFL